MVNSHKSTADAAALLALSQLYRGIAALEVVDMTQLTSAGVVPATAVQERAKLAEATTHFSAASEALARAIEVCSARGPQGDCAGHNLESLKTIVDRLGAAKGGALPALEDVQAVMVAAADLTAAWSARAEALRGAKGHYPAKPDATP